MDEWWFDSSSSVRLAFTAVEDLWLLYASASQAYRAPGLSDLTRFDVSKSSDVETPSTNLDPETYLCGEVGTRVKADPVELQAERLGGRLALRPDVDLACRIFADQDDGQPGRATRRGAKSRNAVGDARAQPGGEPLAIDHAGVVGHHFIHS